MLNLTKGEGVSPRNSSPEISPLNPQSSLLLVSIKVLGSGGERDFTFVETELFYFVSFEIAKFFRDVGILKLVWYRKWISEILVMSCSEIMHLVRLLLGRTTIVLSAVTNSHLDISQVLLVLTSFVK